MARIDLQRITERFARELHRELIDLKLGPLGPDASEEGSITYQQFTLPLPLNEDGCPIALVKMGASALAGSVREAKPSYLARMPMPEADSGINGVRIDREDWRLSIRVLFEMATPLRPYGALILDMVGVPGAGRVH